MEMIEVNYKPRIENASLGTEVKVVSQLKPSSFVEVKREIEKVEKQGFIKYWFLIYVY